ncbi:MAG: hypothetical protein COY66_06320, partial [Candidatus Kerfeldbacteria bacterium CG_4_10_14_0_8_um_filter_42_10]
MPKSKKQDWFIFGEWYGLYWFHSPYIYGLYSELKKNIGYTLEKQVWEFKDDVQYAYFSKSEWNNIGQRYFEEVKAKPKLLGQNLEEIEKAAATLFAFNNKIRKVDFPKASWKEIVSNFANYHKLHYQLWCLGMIPNLLELNNTFLSSYLTDYLKSKENSDQPKASELFQQLTTPLTWSYNQKEEYDFLVLVARYQKNKTLVNKLKSTDDLAEATKILQNNFKKCWRDLTKHHHKYYWLQYSWTGPALKIDYFVDIFRRSLNKKGLSRKAVLMKKNQDNLENDKKKWFKKLKIDRYHHKLFELMTGIIHSKVVRMDALYQSYCFMEPLLKRVASEFQVSLRQIYAIYDGDLVNIFKKKKFPADLANEILKHSVYFPEKGKLVLYTGQKARKIMEPILKSMPKPQKIKELIGECGCPGKAKGVVKVIAEAQEMGKMKEGNIMVSQITNPSLVP